MIPYTTQSLVIGYHSRVIFLPANKPHTDMTPKILNTALKSNHNNINIRVSEEQKTKLMKGQFIWKDVICYLPTIVPIPRSLLVTNVPIMLVKNSGALVPKLK